MTKGELYQELIHLTPLYGENEFLLSSFLMTKLNTLV